MSNRLEKLNSLFINELSALINKCVDFKPGVFVTISKVEVSEDLKMSKVYVQSYPNVEENYALKTLEHEKAKLVRELGALIKIKSMPKIHFIPDRQGELSDTMTEIFKETDY